jgi:spoIIIJ-associated protein
MNAYERHVIHTTLQEFENVDTSSVGTEPNRRVVVSYTGPDAGTRSGSYRRGGYSSGY